MDNEEGIGDGDDINKEEGQDVECRVAEESRSPSRSSYGQKSEGASSDSQKRQEQADATIDLIWLMHAKYVKEL